MKISNKILMFLATLAIAGTSCSNDEPVVDGQETKDKALAVANEQFVDKTVIPTYSTLADRSIALQNAVEALLTANTDANVALACKYWKEARQYWEWSEAFLFGAASKYYIDPHIDTWPLDKKALEDLLASDKMMENIDATVANLNNGLVGFHGIEYIIFRDGAPRAASAIALKEIRYAVAVAKDLTLSSVRLEAAWAGIENVTADKGKILKDAEMEPEDNFGEQMRLSGQAGSVWKSITAGSEQIIEGCKTIVDEVGNSKIGKPHTGEDVNYIESPHSYNSIQDFYDNIESVKFAYYGGLGADSAQTGSISDYLKGVDQTTNQTVIDAINNCLAKIDAMPRPFVLNYKDSRVGDAIEACNNLNVALEAARKILLKN
ncbi:MAG: imelysin family protein [Muribaculaceae bacterium]|nr:imelysin family protein [Muribaculaceae bacterium]